jgi:5-methylcytosine-specific restriction endonuclease McrA
MNLYKFDRLDAKLTEMGFRQISGKSGFLVIKDVDFKKEYEGGNIEFPKDGVIGVYLTLDGKEWKGYMHLAESYFSRYKDHPKFHLTNCKTIQDFIAMGTFKQRYIWSNSNKVDLVDDTTNEKYNDITLELCKNCRKLLLGAPTTTESFFDKLDKSDREPESIVEVNIFGYVKNWQKISKEYRNKQGYTCESCGITPKKIFDRRYWHVHHKDGNKTNNNESNLECLCVLCHSYKDIRHEENFDRTRMKRELDSFVESYSEELVQFNNPYIALP